MDILLAELSAPLVQGTDAAIYNTQVVLKIRINFFLTIVHNRRTQVKLCTLSTIHRLVVKN